MSMLSSKDALNSPACCRDSPACCRAIRSRCVSVAVLATFLCATSAVAQLPIVDEWRFTVRPPAEGWREPDFDDGHWEKGAGGFGTTPSRRTTTR